MSDREQISDAITRMSRAINAPTEEGSQLALIADAARNSMPEIDHVGISVAHSNGDVETKAATSDLVRELDQLQYSLGEGPCLHAIESDPVVVVEDARNEERWPRFMKAAAELGLRSQLGVRLYLDEHARGGFNLYSTSSDSIDSETQQLAELFASHAALAMGRVRSEENLNAALASQTNIGIAIGIVMERYGMDRDRAFSYLTRIASTSETKLRAVAEHIVEVTAGRSQDD